MNSPLVSVIIAFLNGEQYLPEAIDSVLAQDTPNWELILVDDGSTDGSTAIARQYAAQWPGKVIYCEHEGHVNKGVSASRNYGVRQATGELIAFLDADDVWLPAKLSAQVAIFQQHPGIGMVAEPSLYWYQWESAETADNLILVGAPAGKVYQPTELLKILYPLSTGAAPCPSGLMLTKQACLAAGFEESFIGSYQLYEDQTFLVKVYAHEKVYISDACHNLYRQRADSCVQVVTENGDYHRVRAYFLEWLTTYFQREHITDKKVLHLLAQALQPYHHPTIHYFKQAFFHHITARVRRLTSSNV
jgi:glycosyltransferase involved in cell wall biosynthesis